MRRSRRRGAAAGAAAGFTLIEVVIAMALGTVVFAAALTSILFLQKSYAATEQFAVNLADQTRLMDSLTMDLRRALRASATYDGSGQMTSLTLTQPAYYNTAASPVAPFAPRLNQRAVYYGNDPSQANLPQVYYRFRASFQDSRAGALFNVVTRQEDTAPEVAVAGGMEGFPNVTFDTAAGAPTTVFRAAIQARVRMSFHPMFQTPATPDTNTIVLHGLTFLRNNDSRSN